MQPHDPFAPSDGASRQPTALEALSSALSQHGQERVLVGKTDLDTPPGGSLPASWYRREQPAPVERRSDLTWPAVAGVVTGVVLISAALVMVSADRRAPLAPTELVQGLVKEPTALEGLMPVLAPERDMTLLIDLARQRAEAGDVLVARTLLARADAAREAAALFLMAETYDGERLAAWGVTDVAADPVKARALYAAANALGHPQADERLDMLKH